MAEGAAEKGRGPVVAAVLVGWLGDAGGARDGCGVLLHEDGGCLFGHWQQQQLSGSAQYFYPVQGAVADEQSSAVRGSRPHEGAPVGLVLSYSEGELVAQRALMAAPVAGEGSCRTVGDERERACVCSESGEHQIAQLPSSMPPPCCHSLHHVHPIARMRLLRFCEAW